MLPAEVHARELRLGGIAVILPRAAIGALNQAADDSSTSEERVTGMTQPQNPYASSPESDDSQSLNSLQNQATKVRWLIVAMLMGFAFLGHFNRVGITVAAKEKFIGPGLLSEVQMG